MAYPSQFSDIYGRVIANVRLDATADVQRAKDAVNASYSDVALGSGFFEGSVAGSTLTGGQQSETFPAALIELEDVTCLYAGIQPRLQQVEWETLLDLRGMIVTGGGPPMVYSLRKNTVEFYPPAQGGELLTYYGSKQPDAYLVADSDVPAIPEPFSKLLEYGASCYMCEFKNDLLFLGNYQNQYSIWSGKFMKFVGQRLGRDELAFRVIERRGVFPPNDRSSDYYLNNVGA